MDLEEQVPYNFNDRQYILAAKRLLSHVSETADSHGIVSENLGARLEFDSDIKLSFSNEKYVKHELDWYLSEDRNIKGHAGIETNKIWNNISAEGNVNSNYGWCIFSDENFNQFDNAIKHIVADPDTKHAVMIYTRPNIHIEAFDGVHANYDMLCTMYVNVLLRNNTLIYFVHMRSCDIYNGIRNDLPWHQYVLEKFRNKLQQRMHKGIAKGRIVFFLDSLHLYARDVSKLKALVDEEQLDEPCGVSV